MQVLQYLNRSLGRTNYLELRLTRHILVLTMLVALLGWECAKLVNKSECDQSSSFCLVSIKGMIVVEKIYESKNKIMR